MLQVPYPRSGVLRCRGRDLAFGSRTLVMGIVNVTPDSFSGDGLGNQVEAAVARARLMVDEGADLIDVGGESTRPGARPVPAAEELDRVLPVVSALRQLLSVPISVDTRKATVADAALAAGAHLINDVAGLQQDPEMAAVCARHGAPVIVMHSPGASWEVAWPARYESVVDDVYRYLERSIAIAVRAGVAEDQIVVDPGFGFGKSNADNLTLLRDLGALRRLGRPVLLGTSRKRTIGALLGGLPVEERLEGSLATIALAVAQGVDIVRTHDARASARAARVADAVVRGTAEVKG
ncbi:MAG TPA: dihydropteroate synthase [Chloroflexota bacterium]|nr:dihydropteroate synthase [Chloroflexota bacterium]